MHIDVPKPVFATKILLNDVRSALNIGSIFRSADAFAVTHIYLTGICAIPPNKEILKTALGATETVAWSYHESAEEVILLEKQQGTHIIAIEQDPRSIYLHQLLLPSPHTPTHSASLRSHTHSHTDSHSASLHSHTHADSHSASPHTPTHSASLRSHTHSHTDSHSASLHSHTHADSHSASPHTPTHTHSPTHTHTHSPTHSPSVLVIFGNEVNGVAPTLLQLADTIVEIPQWGEKKSINVAVAAGIVLWDLVKKGI